MVINRHRNTVRPMIKEIFQVIDYILYLKSKFRSIIQIYKFTLKSASIFEAVICRLYCTSPPFN